MGELTSRLRAHFRFSKEERSGLLWTILATAFVLSAPYVLQKWDVTQGDILQIVTNFITNLFVVTIAIGAHVSMQKISALKLGYQATYTFSRNGIFFWVLLAFLSYGFIPAIIVGTVTLDTISRLRLGRFRYGLNYKDLAKVSFAGPLANLTLILLVSPFITNKHFGFPPVGGLLDSFFWANFLIAVYAMLPLPHCSGLNMIIGSRNSYVFSFFFIFAFFLLVWAASLASIIFAAIVGLLALIVYGTVIEQPTK